MTVGPNAADEELNPARIRYLLFVGVALRFEVGGVAVKQIGILWLIGELIDLVMKQFNNFAMFTLRMRKAVQYLNVNVGEEVLPHVGVVALLVGPRQLHVLVHVECFHVLKIFERNRETRRNISLDRT